MRRWTGGGASNCHYDIGYWLSDNGGTTISEKRDRISAKRERRNHDIRKTISDIG